MQKFTLAAITALMAASPAFAAPAQSDDWLPEAQRINREIVRQRSSDARELQLFNGNLAQNRSQNHTIQLQAGKSYTFFADCDRQCSDIDLKLTDSNGKTIKEDNDDDDNPIINSAIATSGTYTLTANMTKCEASSGCAYSIQAFENGSWLPEAQKMNRDIVRRKDAQARQVHLFNGRAAKEQNRSHQVQLTAGKYYSFFADCDYSCNDIDLTLKAADGRVIKEDSDDDDSPIFGWRANRTGSYTLTVTMPKCDTEQCEYSSQVFMGTKPVFDR